MNIRENIVAICRKDVPDPLHTAWLIEKKHVDGHTFMEIEKKDYRVSKVLGNDTTMLKHLLVLRNEATTAAMSTKCTDDFADTVQARKIDRKRKEMVDEIPKSIVVTVTMPDDEKIPVRVAPSCTCVRNLNSDASMRSSP